MTTDDVGLVALVTAAQLLGAAIALAALLW